MGSGPVAVASTSYFMPNSEKDFADLYGTIEYVFTLKRLHGLIRTCSKIQSRENS